MRQINGFCGQKYEFYNQKNYKCGQKSTCCSLKVTLEKFEIWNEYYYINQFEYVSYICIYISIFINIDNFMNCNFSDNKISFFKSATKQLMNVIISIISEYALNINYFYSQKKK